MFNLEQLYAWLEQALGIGSNVQVKLLYTVIALLSLWGLYVLLRRSILNRIKDTNVRYQWRKTLGYFFMGVGVLVLVSIWLDNLGSLATYFGLLSAGLAVALKDPITDLIGWAFILLRKPFEIGDRIQIGENAGDVIDLGLFQFTLMEIGNWVHSDQSTGRVLHVPNSKVFSCVQANYTKGSDYIWNELNVLLTFESNWEKAKRLLDEIARRHTEQMEQIAEESFRQAASQYMLRYGKLTARVYTTVEDSGVMLTIRYLCEPRDRRGSAEKLWESILQTFSLHPDIDFAYPTLRIYDNLTEGKQAG